MSTVSRDSFSAAKDYRRVQFQTVRALLDFELNELQDIHLELSDRLAATLADGSILIGGGGYLTPAGSARSVVVAKGIAVHNSTIVRIPAVAALAIYNGGTVSGTVTSCVFVDWFDEEILSGADAGMLDGAFGETAVRTKRNVTVGVNIGSSALPTPVGGHSYFKLAVVVHNFDTNGTTVLQSDITMEPTAVSPGELSGQGPVRPITLKSRAANGATAVAHIHDTISAITTAGAKHTSWRVQGVEKASLDKDGNFSGGTVNGISMASIGAGGAAIVHNNLSGLTSGDPHTQYVALAAARTITAQHTFNPASALPPFILGANALGQLVTGLNAEKLGGQLGSYYQSATNITTGTLAAGRLPATAMQTDVAQTVSAKKTSIGAATTVLFGINTTGDAVDRLTLRTDGRISWGGGAGATDVDLYRNGAGILKSDGKIQANQLESTVATGTAPLVIASTTIVPNLNAGLLGGQAAAFYQSGTNITTGTVADARLSANVGLLTGAQTFTGAKTFQGGSASTDVLTAKVSSLGQASFTLRADGMGQWGSGAAAVDTNLYRSAVGTLKTDTKFIVGGTFQSIGVATLSAGGLVVGALRVTGQSYSDRFDNGNSAAFNFNNGNGQFITMNGNKSAAFTNGQAGAVYVLEVLQDATGGRTMTWPASVIWSNNNTAPTLSTAPNTRDLFTFFFNGTNYLSVISGIGYPV